MGNEDLGAFGSFRSSGVNQRRFIFLSGDTGVCWFYFLMFSFPSVPYSFLGPFFLFSLFFLLHFSDFYKIQLFFSSSKGGVIYFSVYYLLFT